MFIEIKGTGNQNKGAEMMLLTILENLRISSAKYVYLPSLKPDQYPFYSSLGLYPKFSLNVRGMRLDPIFRIIPERLRNAYGLVLDKEVNAIIDASGFAYSDQWGSKPTIQMAANSKRWKSQGKKVILLPQAFGPFTSNLIRDNMKVIIENSDLIYARDDSSYHYLKDLSNSPKIKQSPDFTTLFKAAKPSYFDSQLHQVCIVPNKRVMDKRSDSKIYIKTVSRIIEKLKKMGLNSYFLIHGGAEDFDLAKQINENTQHQVEIICETDPARLKGMISSSLGLVGSRYHSIASALYSGTVAIGIGWSHKYEHLFSEMGLSEGLIDVDISDPDLDKCLELFHNLDTRRTISRNLKRKADEQRSKSASMFSEVKNCLMSS